jgi:phospholipase/carboxylesterase
MARSQPRRKRIAQLEALVVEGDPSAATVVLFHGFGADMSDLATLADMIQAPKGTNWVFPNGHLTVPLGGHYEGRAWFPISVSELERSMAAQGQSLDWSNVVPPGLKKARQNAMALIEALNVPMDKLVLGGFSQGGMLAVDVTLHSATPPKGLVVLSGTLVNEPEWKELAPKHRGLEFFQSHGFRDSVLGFPMAQRLEKLFKDAGWSGQLQRFEGAHEIPPEVLIQLGAYLRKRLA